MCSAAHGDAEVVVAGVGLRVGPGLLLHDMDAVRKLLGAPVGPDAAHHLSAVDDQDEDEAGRDVRAA